jgi:predicted nucleic acid-binding protein
MILVDTGPMVALVDPNDQYHGACLETFKKLLPPLGTVWPVITETMYLLTGRLRGQEGVWGLIERGAIELLPFGLADVPRTRELMRQYADLPMDLADAALIAVAEREGIRKIFTVDRKDFSVYRLLGRVRPTIIP